MSKLNINEQKLRDLYLRKLSIGEIQGPPTGFASIDKPWLKYYQSKQIESNLTEKTCYEALLDSYRNNPSHIAIEFFGKRITYSQLVEEVDKTAKAYQKLGIKKGDIVTFLVVNSPEVVYSFYALNKLGAISNMVDPRSNAKGLENYLNEVNSKTLVTIDICYPNVEKAIPNTNIENVVYFPAINSAPNSIKIGASLISKIKSEKTPDIPQNKTYIKWNEFIEAGKKEKDVIPFKYVKNYPAAIVHTGGTTGVPKGVLLSNDNFNAVTCQVKNSPIGSSLEIGDKYLNILVPFVAYGLALGMHAPMSLGWDSVLIPKFDPKDIVKLMKKNKPTAVMGIQTYYEALLNDNSYDFSNTKAMLMGGMPTKEEFEKNMNDKIIQGNGNFQMSKGYSMTEASSCATCSYTTANEIGSNGVPLVKTVVAAFDPVSGEELRYNQPGEICIMTPTRMIEYYKNKSATDEVIKLHEDGNLWIHSGDIGYVTENGFVYIIDRIKRMIIRSGFKVFPSEIENTFLKHPAVISCAVVAVDDEKDNKAPKAHVVLKEEFHGMEKQIRSELDALVISDGLPSYFTPVDYKFRNELPLTNIGKIDFVSLENEDKCKEKQKIKQ